MLLYNHMYMLPSLTHLNKRLKRQCHNKLFSYSTYFIIHMHLIFFIRTLVGILVIYIVFVVIQTSMTKTNEEMLPLAFYVATICKSFFFSFL